MEISKYLDRQVLFQVESFRVDGSLTRKGVTPMRDFLVGVLAALCARTLEAAVARRR